MPSWLTVGASWMSRPTPWPVPCSNRSAQPASAMTCAADVVDLLGRDARAARRPRRRPATADDVEDAGQLAVGLGADAERAGHVGAVALEGGAEVDDHRVARRIGAVGRAVVGLGRVRAGGDDRLEGRCLGPAPAHGGVERQGELLLGRTRLATSAGSTSPSAASAMAAARCHPGDLAGVLDLAQRLDRRRWSATSSVAVEQLSAQRALAGPAHVVGLEADPGDAARQREPRPRRWSVDRRRW